MPRLPALQHADYRNYLVGSFVSNVGNMLQSSAIALQVYHLTGSSYMVGALGLVRVVPLLIFSFIGGIYADHHDRKRILMVTQICMALVALAMTGLSAIGNTNVYLIYLLVALFAVARAFDGPARQSMVPNLVPRQDLPNAIGINGMSWRLSDVLGPVIAGLIIYYKGFPTFGGYGTCYLLNFVSFGAVLVALMKLPAMPPIAQEADKPQNLREVVKAIGDGLAFVHKTPVLRSSMWIDFWATFFSSADALLPAYAKDILKVGEAGFGLLQGSIGIGALIGATVMTWLPTVKKQGRLVIVMVGLYGLFTILFGFSTNLVLAMFFLAGTGFADMVSTVMRQTIRQLATPDRMRGRMSATSMLFNITGPQLGDYEAGTLAVPLGERWSVAVGGLASILVAAHWGRARALRDYEMEEPDSSPKGESVSLSPSNDRPAQEA